MAISREQPTLAGAADDAADDAAADSVENAWERFAERHPGHPALNDGAVYALDPYLIRCISDVLSDFWTDDEIEFEKDLARSAGGGFFLERPFGYLGLSHVPRNLQSPGDAESLEQARAATGRIRDMLAEGVGTDNFEKYEAATQKLDLRIAERQQGYAAWLVTEHGYRAECTRLHQRWAAKVRELGGFPRLPISAFGETPPPHPREDRPFYDEYESFLRRWGLERLATWQLPVPTEPGVLAPSLTHLPSSGGAGIELFVPWYLLRDQDLTLRDVAQSRRLLDQPHHLDDWLKHQPKRFGYARFGQMLRLYIYLELALKRRYPNRLRGSTERLDKAFGRYFGTESYAEADNIKKIRLLMNQRLRQDDSPDGATSRPLRRGKPR